MDTLIATPAMLLLALLTAEAAIVPPPWADPTSNPCATQPRGWQLLYWPADGKCYKIFQIGAPCPESMELSPSAVGAETRAECRCPPGTAQSPRDALCHPIFTRASCPDGQYFAPVPEAGGKPSSRKRWGVCREAEACPADDQVFWPRDAKCYRRHSRGPCQKGELLVAAADGLATCGCSRDGELAAFYSALGQGCYEHYTRGPCQQPGELFLPGAKCGCRPELAQYHAATRMCYALGGAGPCALGQRFAQPAPGRRASCSCKPDYVPYADGRCYRAHTQGPCPPGEMLLNSTSCVRLPCARGRLYFPREGTCYRVGSRGPCPAGQVVLYDYSARPSLDGISYSGVCGCKSSAARCSPEPADDCEDSPGTALVGGACHRLYTRAGCAEGEWLVAQRRPKDEALWARPRRRPKARCECRPGYTRTPAAQSAGCQAPSVGLAKFLNDNAKSLSLR